MDLFLWLFGAIGSGLIGVLLAVLFQDQIRIWLASRVQAFRKGQKKGVEGKWRAVFSITRNSVVTEYVEIIEITKAIGIVEGHIAPDDRNYDSLKAQAENRPIRLRGEVGESFYLSGIWFHPLDTHRFTGAFQLLLEPSGRTMRGKWVGFSESLGSIDSGDWTFEREPDRN